MKLQNLIRSAVLVSLLCLFILGCQDQINTIRMEPAQTVNIKSQASNYQEITSRYNNAIPHQWGEKVSGVAYRLDTNEKVLALTFDACGGSGLSNGYDSQLIDFLEKMQVPATLFVTGKWIDAHPDIFNKLAHTKLFEIENHGLNHLPCSVSGKKAYNIQGTSSIEEAIHEVDGNGIKIKALTGRKPIFYRSGTNFYDEVAVAIVKDLGYTAVGYSNLGDAGATFNRDQVKKALLDAQAGSIVICHFNHPEGETAEGIIDAIPILLNKGFKFVTLSDYPVIVYP